MPSHEIERKENRKIRKGMKEGERERAEGNDLKNKTAYGFFGSILYLNLFQTFTYIIIYIKLLKIRAHLLGEPLPDIKIIHKSWYTNSRPRGS